MRNGGVQGGAEPLSQGEAVCRVELQAFLVVFVVAPAARVEHFVERGLGAEIERVQVRECLVQAALYECVGVVLPVVGRVGRRARYAACGAVQVRLGMPFSSVEAAPEVGTGPELAYIVVRAPGPVCKRVVSTAPQGSEVGTGSDPVGKPEVEPGGGHPCPEGAGFQRGASSEGLPGSEYRPRGVEAYAVLGVVDYGRRERTEVDEAQVRLPALYVGRLHSVYVDGGVRAAESAQADAFQTGQPAVVAETQRGREIDEFVA